MDEMFPKRILVLIFMLETPNSSRYLSATWLFARPAANITFHWGSCDRGAEKGRGWVCSRGPDLPVSALRLSSCGAPHWRRKWFSQKTPPSTLRTRRATSFSIKHVVLPKNNKISSSFLIFHYRQNYLFPQRILIKSIVMVPWYSDGKSMVCIYILENI